MSVQQNFDKETDKFLSDDFGMKKVLAKIGFSTMIML
jgi:hypothetical protein